MAHLAAPTIAGAPPDAPPTHSLATRGRQAPRAKQMPPLPSWEGVVLGASGLDIGLRVTLERGHADFTRADGAPHLAEVR